MKQCSGKRIRNKSSVFKPLSVAKTCKENFVQRILRIFWSVQTFVLPFVSRLYYGERSRGQNEMENSLLSFEVKRAAVAAFPINWISHTARSAPASFDSQQHITKIGDKIRCVMSLNLEILMKHNFCPCFRRDCWFWSVVISPLKALNSKFQITFAYARACDLVKLRLPFL